MINSEGIPIQFSSFLTKGEFCINLHICNLQALPGDPQVLVNLLLSTDTYVQFPANQKPAHDNKNVDFSTPTFSQPVVGLYLDELLQGISFTKKFCHSSEIFYLFSLDFLGLFLYLSENLRCSLDLHRKHEEDPRRFLGKFHDQSKYYQRGKVINSRRDKSLEIECICFQVTISLFD